MPREPFILIAPGFRFLSELRSLPDSAKAPELTPIANASRENGAISFARRGKAAIGRRLSSTQFVNFAAEVDGMAWAVSPWRAVGNTRKASEMGIGRPALSAYPLAAASIASAQN